MLASGGRRCRPLFDIVRLPIVVESTQVARPWRVESTASKFAFRYINALAGIIQFQNQQTSQASQLAPSHVGVSPSIGSAQRI